MNKKSALLKYVEAQIGGERDISTTKYRGFYGHVGGIESFITGAVIAYVLSQLILDRYFS